MVFDVWHFVGSKSDLGCREQFHGTGSIPATYDGPLELQPSVPVKASCYDRKFPGDGEFPNAPIVSVLAPNNGLNQIRHEVFSAILADECGTGQPHQCGLL